MKKLAYVGIDYHIKSLTVAVIIEGEKDFNDTIRLKNENMIISKYLKKLSTTTPKRGGMRVTLKGLNYCY